MGKCLRKFFQREMVRYLFFGGCTTAVNLAVYSFLRYVGKIPVNHANLISIVAAIVFAFFGNRFWVFAVTDTDRRKILAEFFGVWFLVGYTEIPDFLGKCLVQVLVIALNYVISKFVVFRKRQVGGIANE